MVWQELISLVKLLFIKDKGLYVFIHTTTGRYPKDIELYRLAMVHRSKPLRLPDGRWVNNERLEYLGDAVLDLVVADYLYHTYPDEHEGFLTSMRAKIVQRESLNRVGHTLHINRHVSASGHSTSHNSYICGNAVEALVGAFYIDHGYTAVKHFIINRIIKAHFNLEELSQTDQNYKSKLLEWTQKYHVTIDFELIDSFNDSDGNPVFKTAVILGGVVTAEGVGFTKKESHQNASAKALERLDTDRLLAERVLSSREQQDA